MRVGRAAVVLLALSLVGCEGPRELLGGDRLPGPRGQGAPVVVAEGEVAGHRWRHQVRVSGEGPVLQWLQDGGIQATSWNFTRTPDAGRPVIASGSAPHADPDDPDSRRLYVQLSAMVTPSLDEVVFVFGDGEVIARARPSVSAPGAGWAPVATVTATLDRPVWIVGCEAGARAGADLAWNGRTEGSFNEPAPGVC